MQPVAVTLLVLAATWDVWRWYARRVAAAPEEAAALAAAVLLLLALAAKHLARERRLHALPLVPITALLAAYAASFALAPPILRMAIAVSAVLFCGHTAVIGRAPPPALWGINLLALPVLPSLQFFLGYPLRLVGSALTALLLQANGLAVMRQGVDLVWRDEVMQFDAPCSGVNMFWAGLLLTLAIAWLNGSGAARLAAAVALSLAMSLLFNVLRATSLFYLESGLIVGAVWWHEAIGVIAFALAAAATVAAAQALERRQPQCSV
jgi:exosortase/archaeosortase family protein